MSTRPSAQIIALPAAAPEPIHQHPRRGRYPAMVTKIRRGYLIKLEARLTAQKDSDAQRALGLGLAEGYYLVCKSHHDGALLALRVAQQRTSKNGSTASIKPLEGLEAGT